MGCSQHLVCSTSGIQGGLMPCLKLFITLAQCLHLLQYFWFLWAVDNSSHSTTSSLSCSPMLFNFTIIIRNLLGNAKNLQCDTWLCLGWKVLTFSLVQLHKWQFLHLKKKCFAAERLKVRRKCTLQSSPPSTWHMYTRAHSSAAPEESCLLYQCHNIDMFLMIPGLRKMEQEFSTCHLKLMAQDSCQC